MPRLSRSLEHSLRKQKQQPWKAFAPCPFSDTGHGELFRLQRFPREHGRGAQGEPSFPPSWAQRGFQIDQMPVGLECEGSASL